MRSPAPHHAQRRTHAPYRTFVGFHALALVRPSRNRSSIPGSPGWLHRIELERSTVGFLAISPWPNGQVLPTAGTRAFAEGDEMRFWIRFPPQLRAGGTVSARTRRTVIPRYGDQLEFEW